MKITIIKTESRLINAAIFLCALLSSLVPRYISTFKIRMGINVSIYTIAVVVAYFLFSHRFVVYKKIQGLFMLIWLIFVVLSVWRAEQFGDWLYYFDWTLTAVLFSQVLYSGDKREDYESVIKGLLLGLIIHLIIGLIEITRHSYFFSVSIEKRSYYGKVPVSIFHNPNDYVTFLITVFPFLIYYMMKQKSMIKKGVYLFFVMLCIYLVIKSMSRTAFFAMWFLCVVVIWLALKKSTLYKLLFIFGGILLIGVIYAIPPVRTIVFSTFMANRIDIVNTDRARVNLIKNGLYFLFQTYGAGVGPGNLRLWLNQRAIYNIGALRVLHNWYIELLATFGILFFLLYVIFHVKIIISLAKRYNPKGDFWTLDNAMLLSLLEFSIVSIASSSNIYSEWVWMYLAFIGAYSVFIESGSSFNNSVEYSR